MKLFVSRYNNPYDMFEFDSIFRVMGFVVRVYVKFLKTVLLLNTKLNTNDNVLHSSAHIVYDTCY